MLVCITGATSGIGQATAKRFACEGWQVLATGRRADRLEKLAKEYSNIQTMVFDVQERQAVAEALGKVKDVDVLVNNAGLAKGLDAAFQASLDDWETMVNTNIKGLMYCTRTLLPGMVSRKKGHIINLGSIAGTYPYPHGNVYCATKAFCLQFSRNLRCDLHGTGVRVTDIEPGLLQSEFSNVRFKGDDERAAKLYAGTNPLHPEDIADIIWWVANQPKHVDITQVEVMPTVQSLCGPRVYYQ